MYSFKKRVNYREDVVNKKTVALIAVFTVIALSHAVAEERVLKPEDHYKVTSVGSPAVSPDGKWIAYSISKYNEKSDKRESNIYLQPFTGGEPLQLTALPGSESGYTWHPKGNKIAFSSSREGKKSQIYVIDIRGGEAIKITDSESGASSPAWSPDGTMISFYSSVGQLYTKEEKKAFGDVHYAKHLRYYHLGPGWDKGKRRRIFVVSAEGGEARQLTAGECADEGDHSKVWSPDSKEIAYVSNREKEWWNTIDTNVFIVNVKTGESRKVSDNIGPDHSPAFSPDGKWLAWRGSFEYNYESENYKILLQPRNGSEYKILSDKLDRNIRNFQWAPDGETIYFSASDRGTRHIQSLNINQPNVFQPVTQGNMQIRSWTVVNNGTFALLKGDSSTSYDLFTLSDGTWNQLTTDGNDWWKGIALQPAEEFWVTTKDGAKVQGWLIKPKGYEAGKKYPMVLSIHGGPHGMYAPGLNFEWQMLAQQGIAVMFTNPRGSDGYGQAFADTIHEDWNTAPFTDLMACVDYAVEKGIADAEKLGVMGGSYGGYMTNWVIGNTPRFKSAISVAGLSNMVSFYGTTDEQFFAEKEMAGTPWSNKEAYLFNSPLWHAEKFVTPTMVIHGENDWRVRPEQGRQLFTALQKMGVESSYVEFPGEQHGIRGREHRTLYYRLKLDWFGHWLQGKDPGLATYIKPEKYTHPPKPIKNEKH